MDVRVDVDVEKTAQEKALKAKRQLQKWKSFPNTGSNSIRGSSRSKKWSKDMYSDILRIDDSPLPKLPEEEEAVGIITMEDVIEELLQVNYTNSHWKFCITTSFLFCPGQISVLVLNNLDPNITLTPCRRRYLMRPTTISMIHDDGFV